MSKLTFIDKKNLSMIKCWTDESLERGNDTFTATFSPLWVRAAWTWASEALASGTRSNSMKTCQCIFCQCKVFFVLICLDRFWTFEQTNLGIKDIKWESVLMVWSLVPGDRSRPGPRSCSLVIFSCEWYWNSNSKSTGMREGRERRRERWEKSEEIREDPLLLGNAGCCTLQGEERLRRRKREGYGQGELRWWELGNSPRNCQGPHKATFFQPHMLGLLGRAGVVGLLLWKIRARIIAVDNFEWKK